MDLQSLVERTATRFGLPGLVAAVSREGSPVCAEWGFGNVDAVFPIASVTKTYTAHRILELAAQGGLDLESPLSVQLPGFRLLDPDATAALTVRDALCHFSGLPPHTWAWVYGDLNRREWILERLPNLPLAGAPREKHRYSNILYAVLGLLIEQVTGESWEEDLQHGFLSPPILLSPETVTSAPTPYAMTENGMEELPGGIVKTHHLIGPASECMASVPQLAEWGLQVLASPYFSRLSTAQNIVSRTRPHAAMGVLEYGLGWRRDTVNGRTRVWHSGQCSGYTSLLSLDPEKGQVFSAACNVSGAVEVLHAMDLFVREGIDPEWASVQCRTRSGMDARPAVEGQIPLGRFHHPGYGDVEVRRLGQGLESVFQHVARAPLQVGEDMGLRLTLAEFGVSFPLEVLSQDTLKIGFGQEGEETLFSRC